MAEVFSVEERDRAAERSIQDALHQQGNSLGAVSNSALCGEILRRLRNRVSQQQAGALTMPVTAAEISEAAVAIPGLPVPSEGEPASGWAARLEAVLDKLLSVVGPIVLDWITKNLPVILNRLLGGIMGS